MSEIGLSELKNITSAIKEKFGYDFSNYAISSYKRRIHRILELKKMSPDALVEKIKNDSFTREEFLHEVTVNVTEMFRDPSFWKSLKTLLTNMYSSREKIRIWHAGCSSGEEVFSMLIMLHEMGVLNKTEIVASDIDKSILAKAKEGKIPSKNMEIHESNYHRFTGNENLSKYFKKEGEAFLFDKDLLQKVSFREIDLVKAIPFNKFDLVLCRNVLIYFNHQLQNEVLKLINECMFESSLLAIGAKESISWCDVSKKFTCINIEEKIYRKNKE